MSRRYAKKIKGYLLPMVCVVCNTVFYVTKFYTKVYKTCSDKCCRKHRSISASGKKNPFYGKKHTKEFSKWQSERVTKQFKDKIRHPRWKGGKSTCVDCGKIITYKYTRCNNCNGSRRMGDKNPFWKGGTSFEPYPATFNQQLKDRIRVRDNFICQLCGVPELECKRRLDIHHIDYNKKNCNENNLTALCNKCNVKVNKNRLFWKKYFQETIRRISWVEQVPK